VNCGFHIGLILANDLLFLYIDNHDRELYDLIESEVIRSFLALALKVIHTDVIEWCLMNVLAIFDIDDLPEKLRGNDPIDSRGKDHLIL
jgi:hypothetical protein